MKKNRSQFTLVERRNVLRTLAAGATLAIPGWSLGNQSIWRPDELQPTPQQTEGPFYPSKSIEQQLYNDTDLTRKLGNHELAKGSQVIVSGVIKNRHGKPIENSIVEIWQACATGRYNHPRDNGNKALLDNNFQFWGRAVTGVDGRYSFQTIIPGKYPGRTARHIHYRVDADGFKRCSTQCYFSEFGADNSKDGIYKALTNKERDAVTVEFDKPGGKQSPDVEPRKGSFDIVMANK